MTEETQQLRQDIRSAQAEAVILVNKGMFHTAIAAIEHAIVLAGQIDLEGCDEDNY